MSGIRFQSVEMLYLLWLVPVLVGLLWYAHHRRRQAMARFVDSDLMGRLTISTSPVRRRWKAALVLTALVAIVIGLTRPGWNPKPKTVQRRGRDVVFLLDVSRSMMAEDLAPNRLERAKLAILDCIERLEGDRVGLVAFAGTAAVKCPLTLDYGFFRMMLADISTESIARGGTMVGDAVRKTLDDVFDDRERAFKDIILITDGEDHDSFPVEAAKQAGERGVRIIAIGLGDENEGRRIPVTGEDGRRTFLKHQGQEVWSRLDADTLRRMVNATPGGKYLNVATGTIDLGDVYTRLVASAEKKELESETVRRYEEKFQVFLAFAFLLLALDVLIREGRAARRVAAPSTSSSAGRSVLLAALLIPAAMRSQADSPRSLVEQGNAAFAEERYEDAFDAYAEASVDLPESAELRFNQGAVRYRQGNYAEAADLFREAARKTRDLTIEAKSHFNLGNCAYREAQRQRDSDLQKAVESCERSIRHYQEALELDSNFEEAAENIEVSRLTIKALLDEIKKQQEEAQKRQEQAQKTAEKLKELAERQQQAAGQSEDLAKKPDSDPGKAESSQQLAHEQRALQEETDELRQSMEQNRPPAQPKDDEDPLDKVQEHLQNALDRQDKAADELDENRPGKAAPPQQEAADELKKAMDAMKEGQNQPQSQPQAQPQPGQDQDDKESQQQASPQDAPQQPPPEARQVPLTDEARDILQEERDNKEQRRPRAAKGYRAVDRDW